MRLKKVIITSLVVLLANINLKAQDCISELDVSTEGADLKFLTKSSYWMQLIKTKNIDELLEYWNPENPIKNKKKLTRNLESFRSDFISSASGHPGIMPLETDELIYERTFYTCDNTTFVYYAQLKIIAKSVNGEYYINEIKLLEGKSVENRDEQILYIRSIGPNNPPPPPPPIPFH